MENEQRRSYGWVVKTADTERSMTIIASAEVEDRQQDIVRLDHLDTRNFLVNPVVLRDHRHDQVIGSVTQMSVQARAGIKALMATVQFVPEGTSQHADEAVAEIRSGARRGISIGFIPKVAEPRAGGKGLEFKESELLEISSVAVPACPTALVETVKSFGGTVDDADVIEINGTLQELTALVTRKVAEASVTHAEVIEMIDAELAKILPGILRTAIVRGVNDARGRITDVGFPPFQTRR